MPVERDSGQEGQMTICVRGTGTKIGERANVKCIRMEGMAAKEVAGLVAVQALRPGQLADELRFGERPGEIPARGGWTVTGGGSAVHRRTSARRS